MIDLLLDPRVIDLVTKSVLGENGNRYEHAMTEIRGRESCHILYLPQSSTQVESFAIVLGIEMNVTGESMKRSIDFCLQVNQRFNIEPIFVLLCTDKISLSVKNLLSTNLENPHWQQLRNSFWAERCLFIFKNSIENNSIKDEQYFDPLVALTWYLASDSREQNWKLKNKTDPTIQLLNTISESIGSERL